MHTSHKLFSVGSVFKRFTPAVWILMTHLGRGVLTLVMIVFLTFFGLDMARGKTMRESFPRALERSGAYLAQLSQGELGYTAERSISRLPKAISEVLPPILARSAGLLLAAMFIAIFLGCSLGIWSARRRHSRWPTVLLISSIAGVSLPSFFLAFVFQLGLIQLTRISGHTWLPAGGFGWDEHILLPAIVLAARPMAQIIRVTAVSLGDVLQQDYVRTAYGKGLTSSRVLSCHAVRNAAIPVFTTIGVSLRYALSSLPIVEYFFGWQGIGYTLLRTIASQDDQFTVIMLLILGAVFILMNILLDFSYRLIDPRLRKQVEVLTHHDQQRFTDTLKELASGLKLSLSQLLDRVRMFFRKPSRPAIQNQPESSPPRETPGDIETKRNWRPWMRATLGNFPLMSGSILMLGLIYIILFGSQLAPYSPYTTRGLTIVNGEMTVPPFSPGEVYPLGTDLLGRDLLSLLLAGAQQTIILASLTLAARLLVGFILGAIAGWWKNRWIDHLLLGLVEMIAAFPSLLLAMTLILALNIRAGMQPFIIALCFVGWGEIMQFIRGEVSRLKPRLFVESARAIGQTTPRILFHHILPNLIPALISVAVLEMGAVLMLLGELGFVSIFIGGGTFAELEWARPLYHYSDVPEWGALLSNIRTYARAYPWLGLYPSLAFFLSILGLNLFGEGLRKMVESIGVRIMRIFNRYTIGLALGCVLAIFVLKGATGEIATFQRDAKTFNIEQAAAHLEIFTRPEMEGRSIGSQGTQLAALYIAGQFEALGLQPAGEHFSYYQSQPRSYAALKEQPALEIRDGGPPAQYLRDFNVYPHDFRVDGEADTQIRFITFGALNIIKTTYTYIPKLDKLAFPDDILMVFEKDLPYAAELPRRGMLVIAESSSELSRRFTLSTSDPNWLYRREARQKSIESAPMLWISSETATRLLFQSDYTLDELRSKGESLQLDEIFEALLKPQAHIRVITDAHESSAGMNIIGHMPGLVSNQAGGIDDHVIAVLAQYDDPPIIDGETATNANDNASGVAAMLEMISTLQKSGYQPYKTLIFIAYSGEGYQGGVRIDTHDISHFLEAKYGFSKHYQVDAVIDLRGLAADQGTQMVVFANGSRRLANILSSSARRMGISAILSGERPDLNLIFEQGETFASGESSPRVQVSWEGWENTSQTPQDTLEHISYEHLEQAGKTLSRAIMILGRETK